MLEGFLYLDEALPGVFWDAKYATADNFTGAAVDGYLTNRVMGTREMAEALKAAQRLAAERGLRPAPLGRLPSAARGGPLPALGGRT